jgi:hypothetical protein
MVEGQLLHITPTEGGEWAIEGEVPSRSVATFATQAEALAAAYGLVRDLARAEVVVHGPDGRVRSRLSIESVDLGEDPVDLEHEEAALSRRAREIMPGIDALLRLKKRPAPEGLDLEADPADLY